ncbi:MAG: DUF4390 domain-containing protein [Xanthomonadales bacterium]|nr:DUF4390 domain-containing protein [Xanthomonadales bacterium]
MPEWRLCAVLLLAVLTGGCGALVGQEPGTLAIRAARVEPAAAGAVLDLELDCELSGPMQDALEHGIPLTLRIDLAAGRWPAERVERRVELRYYPLSQRYQLRESGHEDVRSFTTRAYLLASLGSLRLDVPAGLARQPAGTRLAVAASLDGAALPGALRLPALFEPAWRLAATEYAWRAP